MDATVLSGDVADASPAMNCVVHEIDRRQNRFAHDAVVGALRTWDFFPYPPCTRKQLEQVDLILVATGAATREEDVAVEMMGAVGIAWVPLFLGAQVEGYVQLVVVRPPHRRHRIARDLLQRALQMTEGGDPRKKIGRWRLHTMVPSRRTSEYLRMALRQNLAANAASNDDGNEDDDDALHEKRLAETERLVDAVPRVYETLGFAVRRNVYAYYAKCADAVEMVKLVQGARKRCLGELPGH